MIKLFVSDIDGTLLNDKHEVAKESKEAIQTLLDSGVKFMTASGRHFESSVMPVKDMNLDIDFIVLNGGDCRNSKGESRNNYPFTEAQVDAILPIVTNCVATIEYYCVDYAYTQIPFDIIEEVYIRDFMFLLDGKRSTSEKFMKEYDVKSVMKYESDVNEIRKHQIIKFEIHLRDVKEKDRVVSLLEKIDGISITASHLLNIEVTHEKATKGNMIEEMMKIYGFKHDEVAVIGDSFNDISMLERFPNSYAMGNASRKVKAHAKYVAPSNKDNGVAATIYKILEENKKGKIMDDKLKLIKNECLYSNSSDPITLMMNIMKKEYINIHGPEHHVLDGACLLTAMYKAGVEFDLEKALDEMIVRGKKMPGATCAQWGMCSSSASMGAALSIIHKTRALSNDSYYQDHLSYVSKALGNIAEVGGPSCCKRNAFISLLTAIDFVNEHYGLSIPKQEITCPFSSMNTLCINRRCPFYKG